MGRWVSIIIYQSRLSIDPGQFEMTHLLLLHHHYYPLTTK